MIELSIYIILAVVFGAIVRIYKAKKSGLFYNLKRIEKSIIHPKLMKYYKNIHFISSPSNYLQQAMVFILVFAICRLLSAHGFHGEVFIAPIFHVKKLFFMLLASFLIAIGQSTLASYWWQIWINRGSGLPDIDPKENHMSEFAWGKISFWFSSGKLFNGKRSKFLPFVGALEVIIGLLIIYFMIYNS